MFMKKLYHYALVVIFFSFLFIQSIRSQIIMSERIQYSQLANSDDKKLFLIDFWATWCGPCVTVSKYLNILQEKYASELYIVSLTEESPEVVKKFLQRHPTKLAVSLDYDRTNFKTYKIKALPRGVLLNSVGKVVWEGNPADLKSSHIDRFLRQNPNKISIYDFLKYKSYERSVNQHITFEGDFKITQTQTPTEQMPRIEQSTEELISIEGTLSQIFAFLLDVSTLQIEVPEELNRTYNLVIRNNINKLYILEQIKNQLKISQNQTERQGEVLEVTLLSYNHLWDKNQVEWGVSTPKFLIDDLQITADNLTIREILALVGQLRQIPIQLMNQPQYVRKDAYDWQIHYHFSDLLMNNLNDYGFKTNLKSSTYISYSFKSK